MGMYSGRMYYSYAFNLGVGVVLVLCVSVIVTLFYIPYLFVCHFSLPSSFMYFIERGGEEIRKVF